MTKYLFPLLLLFVGCSKKSDPAPTPPPAAPAVPRLEYFGWYSMAYLESVSPTISLDLSSTPGVDWTNVLNTKEPYYSSEVQYPPYQYSTVAGETLTLTLRVPRMPIITNSSADFRASLTFAGQTKLLRMDKAFLVDPASYGPSGAVMTVSITRP